MRVRIRRRVPRIFLRIIPRSFLASQVSAGIRAHRDWGFSSIAVVIPSAQASVRLSRPADLASERGRMRRLCLHECALGRRSMGFNSHEYSVLYFVSPPPFLELTPAARVATTKSPSPPETRKSTTYKFNGFTIFIRSVGRALTTRNARWLSRLGIINLSFCPFPLFAFFHSPRNPVRSACSRRRVISPKNPRSSH